MGHHGCDSDLDDDNASIRRANIRANILASREKVKAERERRVRELEWAATYVKTHEKPRCRCGGDCERCREYWSQADKIGPDAVLELIAMRWVF